MPGRFRAMPPVSRGYISTSSRRFSDNTSPHYHRHYRTTSKHTNISKNLIALTSDCLGTTTTQTCTPIPDYRQPTPKACTPNGRRSPRAPSRI